MTAAAVSRLKLVAMVTVNPNKWKKLRNRNAIGWCWRKWKSCSEDRLLFEPDMVLKIDCISITVITVSLICEHKLKNQQTVKPYTATTFFLNITSMLRLKFKVTFCCLVLCLNYVFSKRPGLNNDWFQFCVVLIAELYFIFKKKWNRIWYFQFNVCGIKYSQTCL